MEKTHIKVTDNLYLVRTAYAVKDQTTKVEASSPTHHIIVDDCSGSMSYDLPRIREQLKERIVKRLREQDTLSIIWFSGKGQYGVLLEGEPVRTLADLQDVNQAIDRWLKPVGLTGFVEPLEEVERLVERLKKKGNNTAFSMCFMSDGCDNQWDSGRILKAAEKAGACVQSTTYVEYGYYGDRARLAAMAEKAGGSLIFAEDFNRYAPILEQVIDRKVRASKKVNYRVEGDVIGGFVFAMKDGDLLTFAVEDGNTVMLPEDVTETFYLNNTKVGKLDAGFRWLDSVYAAISLFSTRMKPNIVWPLLKATGDTKFIDQFSTCFGKQKYSDFQEETKTAAFVQSKQQQAGTDFNRVPKDDAFTLLDLLRVISEHEDNRVVLDHPEWKYNRIGRKREADDNAANLVFTPNDFEKITGYSVTNLVFNEDRPNVSIQVRKKGTVRLPEEAPTALTNNKREFDFETSIVRNYAIIKDGLVNVDKLPCRLTTTAVDSLIMAGVKVDLTPEGIAIIDLKALPIINRKMVQELSVEQFFRLHFTLNVAQAQAKVYSAYLKELFPDEDKAIDFQAKYGEAASKWLQDHGVKPYGFSPIGQKTAAARDYYMGKELKVSLKGLSSLPSLKDARTAIERAKEQKKEPTLSVRLMLPAITSVEETRKNLSGDKLRTWLERKVKDHKSEVRGLLAAVSQRAFTIIVGQTWFTEFKSLDENTWKLDIGGSKQELLDCKVEQKEIQIEI